MIVEHVFVTTFPAEEALGLASHYLQQRGFVPLDGSPAGGPTNNTITLGRGRGFPYRNRPVLEVPQRVRVEYDRGRVTVAGSIEDYERSVFGLGARAVPPDSAAGKLHVALLVGIVTALEALLVGQASPDEAGSAWDEAEDAIAEAQRKRQRRKRFVFSGCLIVVLLFILLIVFAAINGR